MSVHVHLAPKMRIDFVEERIEVMERMVNTLRLDNQRLQQLSFALASRLSEVEQHQAVLRNIMARIAQRMEVLERDFTNVATQRNRPVCSLDSDKLRVDSEQTNDTFASMGQGFRIKR